MNKVPYCPKCGGRVLSLAHVENYYPIINIATDKDRKGYSLEIGDLEDSYEEDSQFCCENECGVLSLEELVIKDEDDEEPENESVTE